MPDSPDRAARSRQSREAQRPTHPAADGRGGVGAAPDLGEVMGQVARTLQEQHGDVEATLRAITASAVRSVPGADECGITLVFGRRRVESHAPTGDLPRELDAVQDELGEGPCVSSIFEQSTVRLDDPATEDRWPRFSARARDLGLGSLLSLQLFVTGNTLGALNVYARRPYAFTEDSESIGLVFATHGSVALAGARHEENLRQAMASRDVIGQAKGVLMERFKVPPDRAFSMLVHASSVTNRKLVDIAEELCMTGVMPGEHGLSPR